jgi:hypothetical protein
VAKLAGPLEGAAESIDGGEERRGGGGADTARRRGRAQLSTSRGRILRSGFIARALPSLPVERRHREWPVDKTER